MPAPILVAYAAEAALPEADPSAADVLSVASAVCAALAESGFAPRLFPVAPDLALVRGQLASARPALVFNLVEALAGADGLAPAFPLLLESLRVPFTGCRAAATALSNDKLLSKRLIAAADIPVPAAAWLASTGSKGGLLYFAPPGGESFLPSDVILKPLSEHASLFMDDAAVLPAASEADVAAALAAAEARHAKPFFAEAFLPGREFSVSLLPGEGVTLAFPPAEIVFDSLPPGRPAIVGYAAKWRPASVEYQATPRRFLADSAEPADAALASALTSAAGAACRALVLGCPGAYARVDFRLDAAGTPVVLEVNANPCLSPDSGFAAAAAKGGIEYVRLVRLLAARAAGLDSDVI